MSSDYHRAFGIPIVQGRPFDARDEDRAAMVAAKVAELSRASRRVVRRTAGRVVAAIVSRQMAQVVWPNEDPIGRSFVYGGVIRAEVVGVAGDVKTRGIREEAGPQAYFAFPGALDDAGPSMLTVKALDDPRRSCRRFAAMSARSIRRSPSPKSARWTR